MFRQYETMMAREYKMTGRARAHEATRERIVRATMALHDEQGVAATSVVDVAKRAGIGAATVYRHFPTLGDLVTACGGHVWAEMRPPVPEAAGTVFSGVAGLEERLLRLCEELDAFYRRGALRLAKAAADRETVPELDGFLRAVEAGVAALVREAVGPGREADIPLLLALTDFPVWQSLQRLAATPEEICRTQARLLAAALA